MTSAGRNYLIEFQRIGNSVKVSAIDPLTGTEVSIIGHANAGRELLKRTAANKLEYVLAKNKKKKQGGGTVA